MQKAVVLYGSEYGCTKKYADLIAENLGCPSIGVKNARDADAAGCSLIVFGGGVYAGSIAGWKKAARIAVRSGAELVLFACGLADPDKQKTQDEAKMLFAKQLPSGYTGDLFVFCLRGRLDYGKLRFRHRAMMAMLMQILKCKKAPSEEDRQLLETYGKTIDFFDGSSAQPVIEKARQLLRG